MKTGAVAKWLLKLQKLGSCEDSVSAGLVANFTQIRVRDADFRRLIIIDYEPRDDLNEIGDERWQQAFHNRRVAQQNELVDHSDLESLSHDWGAEDWKSRMKRTFCYLCFVDRW